MYHDDPNTECIAAFNVACQYAMEHYHHFPGMEMIGVPGLSGMPEDKIKSILEEAIIAVCNTVNATIFCRNSMITITPDLFMPVVRATIKKHMASQHWADYLCTLYVEMCHVSQVRVNKRSKEKEMCMESIRVMQLDGLIKYVPAATTDYPRGHLKDTRQIEKVVRNPDRRPNRKV